MRRVLFLSLMAALTWPVAAASAATPTLTAVSPGLARTDGGTVLTLRGTGFTAGLTVLIDGVPATVFPVSFNTTQVVVVAPPHVVGAATVTVTNTLGESVSQGSLLTYVDFPAIGLAAPIVRASLTTAGIQGTIRGPSALGSFFPRLSGDGTFVAFSSETDLGYGARIKIYVKNLETGELALVSACGDCGITSITPDGTRVGFTWFGVGGVRTANFADAPYGGTSTRIDVSAAGVVANAPTGGGPVLSADGRYAAFSSAATNLEGTAGDTAGSIDLFVKDLLLGVIERWTLGKSVSAVTMSGDGRVVAFTTTSALLPSDSNTFADIYMIDRAVGLTSLRCLTTGSNAASSALVLADDGATAAFVSAATNLIADDTNGIADVFVVDVASGAFSRVTVATDGTPATLASSSPAINANGRFVAFVTASPNLVAGDLSGTANVFVRDRLTGVTYLADAASDGMMEDHSGSAPAFSADGRVLVFATVASNLVADDTNALADVYRKTMPPDTPLGTGVAVNPVDPDSGSSPMTITFDQITGGGVTSLTTATTGPAVPAGFQLSGSTYFNLSTTAAFSGSASLCLNYAAMTVSDAGALRLLHFANDQWNDITTSNDTGAKIICGSTTSLSPFAIAERFDLTPPVIAAHGDVTAAATSTAGAVVSYDLPTAEDDIAGAVAVTCAPASGSLFAIGDTVVTCTATDPAGNAASTSFLVQVARQESLAGRMTGEVAVRAASGRIRLHFDIGSATTDHHVLKVDVDKGRHFSATLVTDVTFANDPAVNPGRSRPVVDSMTARGQGRWNGAAGYTFELVAVDRGEPGAGQDSVSLVIRDAQGVVVASVSDVIDTGNVQSLRPKGGRR